MKGLLVLCIACFAFYAAQAEEMYVKRVEGVDSMDGVHAMVEVDVETKVVAWSEDEIQSPEFDHLDKALAFHCGLCKDSAEVEAYGSATLQGQGFHRTLHYSLALSWADAEAAHSNPETTCEMALLQPLPAAVYANIYELKNLATAGKGPRVRLFGKTDLESVQEEAEPTVLAVYANITLTAISTDSQDSSNAEVELSFPLHGRYPAARFPDQITSWRDLVLSPMSIHELDSPEVMIRCPAGRAGAWKAAPAHLECETTWELPAANLIYADAVPVVTIVVVLGAAVVVMGAALMPKKSGGKTSKSKNQKGSPNKKSN